MDKFRDGLVKLKIELNEYQMGQFLKYYEMLVEKNKVMNLTAITNFDEVVEKHFLDSLEIAQFIDFSRKECVSVIDIGTGAGFPGIPLKITFPAVKIVLLDSLKKRVRFLDEVIDELNLEDITTLHGRAEDYGKEGEYRETFDYCVSRAVANLNALAEYCLPYVKPGGYFIPYKSGNIEAELNQAKYAISLLGGKIEKTEKFIVGDAGRSLVFVKKERNTPKKYPRKAGMPTKEPLN